MITQKDTKPATGTPGQIIKVKGQTYQWAETTGMAGSKPGQQFGWIKVNI